MSGTVCQVIHWHVRTRQAWEAAGRLSRSGCLAEAGGADAQCGVCQLRDGICQLRRCVCQGRTRSYANEEPQSGSLVLGPGRTLYTHPFPLICRNSRASKRASCMNKDLAGAGEPNSSDPVHLQASICALSADTRSARSHAGFRSSSCAQRTPTSRRPMQILLDVMAQTIFTKFHSFMRHGI